MELPFQVDQFHFNNHLGTTVIGDRFSGFSLADQTKATCLVFNEEVLSQAQLEELQRVNLILAQQESEHILKPLAWGMHENRHYLVLPEMGRPLGSYENLKALPPGELLMMLRRLLRGLRFAEGKEIAAHQSVRPDNIAISLETNEVKLGFFGYPTVELAPELVKAGDGDHLLAYMPPPELKDNLAETFQYDLYALGLLALELATARPWAELLAHEDQLEAQALRERIGEQDSLPLPLRELIYKLLTPVADERYESYQQALDDVVQLAGKEEAGLSFQTFILDTLISGRFQLKDEIAQGRVSRLYRAVDTRDEEGPQPCVVKLIDLRSHPEMSEVFHTRFRQLLSVKHEHLLEVYDVGVHFENGFIAMEAGLVSLEELLIKRGTLPLTDAGRIVFQLCKALEGLHFNNLMYHGAIKPSNVFLTTDLRTVKLGDALTADYFLRHGNLNYIGAEYYHPEFIKGIECDVRSDIYSLGILLFEMLVGHPPFSFKIEKEIVDEHLNLGAAVRVEPALFSPEGKDIVLRMLEKNPAARYQTIAELKEDLTILLGYDKKEQVEIPNLFFDFSELSMVGKNAREKSEETLAIRLPAVSNRARGAVALLVGHGKELGDASRAATSALKSLREMLFNPATISPEFAKLQKSDPEQYMAGLLEQLNTRLYREAFASGKTRKYGLSAIICIVQQNTLYLCQVGELEYTLFTQGEILDLGEDKWTITEEATLGSSDTALSSEEQPRLGYGEVVHARRLKRRVKDGDQLLIVSDSLTKALSISELKELVTSSGEPSQAVELVRSDAIRRRLEGTISCVLLSFGNVLSFADETVSHAKKGLLARNFLALGDNHLSDGRIDEAIEQYTQALEINPNFSIIHHQLGVAYVRKGLQTYALSCFERALQLNNKLAASYVEIARILQQQRRQREVLPLLRKAVDCGCRDAELFALMGHELVRVRNFDEAILYCTHALDLNSAHPTAFRDRMIAIKRRGALDTKLLKMFAARPRLADEKKARIEQTVEDEE